MKEPSARYLLLHSKISQMNVKELENVNCLDIYFANVGGFFRANVRPLTTNTIIKVNNNKCRRTFDDDGPRIAFALAN